MAYTLNGERVQLVIDDNSGGAITEIAIDGVNLVNSANKFRQVQFGLTWSDKTGSFFLSESGNSPAGPAAPPTAELVSAVVEGDTLITTTKLGYPLPSTTTALGSFSVAETTLEKRVTVDYLGNPNIIRLESVFNPAASTKLGTARLLFSASTIDALNRYFYYDPTVLAEPFQISVGSVAPATFSTANDAGIIYSNQNGSLALGVYSRGAISTNVPRRFTLLAPAASPGEGGTGLFAGTMVVAQETQPGSGLSADKFWNEQFVVVGTYAEVASAFKQIFTGIPLSATAPAAGPAAYLSIVAFPLQIATGTTFSVVAQALDENGLVDVSYTQPFSLTSFGPAALSGPNTATPTNGTAVFSGVSATALGTYFAQVTSGSLVPASHTLQVVNPVPVLLFTDPTTFTTSAVPATIGLGGQSFLAGMTARITGTGITTPITVPCTVLTATTATFVPPAEMQVVGTFTISLQNIGSAGLFSNTKTILVSAAPVNPVANELVIDVITTSLTVPASVTLSILAIDSTQFDAASKVIDVDVDGTITLTAQTLPAGASVTGLGAVPMVNGVAQVTLTTNFDGTFVFRADGTALSLGTKDTPEIQIVNPSLITLNSVSPASIPEDSPATTITVSSTQPGLPQGNTTIRVNGLALPTTSVNFNTATAVIPESMLKNPGTLSVDVVSTNPVTTSNSIALTITDVIEPPAALEFTSVPSSAVFAGSPFQVQVRVLDTDGKAAGQVQDLTITVALQTPGSAQLSGYFSKTVNSNIVVFDDLSIDTEGTYVLTATAVGLTSAESPDITISIPAAQIVAINPASVTPAFFSDEGSPAFGLTYWGDVPNQLGINFNFWNIYEDFSYCFRGNLRYATTKAVGFNGDGLGTSPDPVLDSLGWPTVLNGEYATVRLFTGMSVPQLYLDGTNRGLLKAYRPGRYLYEVWTNTGVANPVAYFAGDGDWEQLSSGSLTAPAVYRVTVAEADRTNQGIEMVLFANGADLKMTNLIIYHENDAAYKNQIYWDPELQTQLKHFCRGRDMEVKHLNELSALISNLSQDPALTWATWDGYGPPPSVIVALCNLADLDYHFCIPAAAARNVSYIDYWATYIRDNLNPKLRVIPTVGNEIWNGPGNVEFDTFKSAYVFQSIHAPALGFSSDFTGRLKAQAHCQRLVHDRFAAIFAGQTHRVVNAVETQNGGNGMSIILDHPYGPDGQTLGQRGVEILIAGYFPTGVDTIAWHQYNPAWSTVQKQAFFETVISAYTQAYTDAINSARIIADQVGPGKAYPNCSLGSYEKFFQEGAPSLAAVPDWSAGASYFLGAPVYWQAVGASNKTIHISNVANPTVGTFIPSQWTNTGAIVWEDYTSQQRINATVGMATLKSIDTYRGLIESAVAQWRALTDKCLTIYKLFSRPDSRSGFRSLGAERNEPYTQSTTFTYTGPYAPNQAILNTTIRPNGIIPDPLGSGGSGGQFTLTGLKFRSDTVLTVDGVVTPAVYVDPGLMLFTPLPAQQAVGLHQVIAKNPGAPDSNSVTYEVLSVAPNPEADVGVAVLFQAIEAPNNPTSFHAPETLYLVGAAFDSGFGTDPLSAPSGIDDDYTEATVTWIQKPADTTLTDFSVPLVAGVLGPIVLNTKADGIYQAEVTFTGAGVPDVTGTTGTVTVTNPVPTIDSIVPNLFQATSNPVTLQITTSGFFPPTGANVIINEQIVLSSTTVSANNKSLSVVLPSSVSSAPGIKNVVVTVDNSVGGAPASSNALSFEVTSPPPGVENLPASIVVGPTSYQRLLPAVGPVITSATPLRDALRTIGKYSSVITPDNTQLFTQQVNGENAFEVVEILAGAYGNIIFSTNNNGPHDVAIGAPLSASAPLLIRARRVSGVADKVVIRPSDFTDPIPASIFITGNSNLSFVHWYDVTVFGHQLSCLATDNKLLTPTGMLGNPAQAFRSWKWVRCNFLGNWDPRIVALGSDRFVRAPLIGTSQAQWNAAGVEIIGGDKSSWTTIQAYDAINAAPPTEVLSGLPLPQGRFGRRFLSGDVTNPAHPNYNGSSVYIGAYPSASIPNFAYNQLSPYAVDGINVYNIWDWEFSGCKFLNHAYAAVRISNIAGVSTKFVGCHFEQNGEFALLCLNRAGTNPFSIASGDVTKAPVLGSDTGGPGAGALVLQGCQFVDNSFQTTNTQVIIRGIQKGSLLVENCQFLGGYLDAMRHLPAACGGGIDVGDDAQFDSQGVLTHWYSNLTTTANLPLVPWTDVLSQFVSNSTCTTLPGTVSGNIVCGWPYLPGPNITNQQYAAVASDPGVTLPGAAVLAGLQQTESVIITNSVFAFNPDDTGLSWNLPIANKNPAGVAAARDSLLLGGIRFLQIDGSTFLQKSSLFGIRIDPIFAGKHISSLTNQIGGGAVPNSIADEMVFAYSGSKYDTNVLKLTLKGAGPVSGPLLALASLKVYPPTSTPLPPNFLMRACVPLPDAYSIAGLEALNLEIFDSNQIPYPVQFNPVAYYPSGNVSVVEVCSVVLTDVGANGTPQVYTLARRV